MLKMEATLSLFNIYIMKGFDFLNNKNVDELHEIRTDNYDYDDSLSVDTLNINKYKDVIYQYMNVELDIKNLPKRPMLVDFIFYYENCKELLPHEPRSHIYIEIAEYFMESFKWLINNTPDYIIKEIGIYDILNPKIEYKKDNLIKKYISLNNKLEKLTKDINYMDKIIKKYKVNNKNLYQEIITVQATGIPTDILWDMFTHMAVRIERKFQNNSLDKDDIIHDAIYKAIISVDKFNSDKSSNAFAYFSEVIKSGILDSYRYLHYNKSDYRFINEIPLFSYDDIKDA